MVRKTKKPIAKKTEIVKVTNANGALGCVATFLVEAFLSKNLTTDAEETLITLFNGCYKTSLSIEQMMDVFINSVKASERAMMLALPLREFFAQEMQDKKEKKAIRKKTIKKGHLFNDVFNFLATKFDLNLSLSVRGKKKTDKTYQLLLETDSNPKLSLRLSVDATNSMGMRRYFANETEKSKEYKRKTQTLITARYNPEFKKKVDKLLASLGFLYSELDVSDAQKILVIQNKLQELCRVFFEKSLQGRQLALEQVKDTIVTSKINLAEPSFFERLVGGSKLSHVPILKEIVTLLSQAASEAKADQDETITLY